MTDLNAIFEKLRLQAEHDTKGTGTDKRKPSWAPALVLGDAIVAALADLKHPPLDKQVARLWATFNSDKTVSLVLGTERTGEGECVLLASRPSGAWTADALANWRGAHLPTMPYRFWQDREDTQNEVKWLHEEINSKPPAYNDDKRKHAGERLPQTEAELAEYERIAAAYRIERAAQEQKREAFKQLILQRVAEFVRDPLEQMADGARITGRCGICGRLLTDPQSVRRGIGPECHGKHAA